MQSFDDYAATVAAFAETTSAFLQDHQAELVLGDAATSRHAKLIGDIGRLIPALHASVTARAAELNPAPAAVIDYTGTPGTPADDV